jgi:hypothetical protein
LEGRLLKAKLLSIQKAVKERCKKQENSIVTIYPPATNDEIEGFYTNRGNPPIEYQQFLKESNGWKNFWNGFHLLGTQEFEDEMGFIREIIEDSIFMAEQVYNIAPDDLVEIRNWETRTVQYYLPHYFIFGVDMKDQVLFFNNYNHSQNGKQEVVLWNKGQGVVKNFQDFEEFIDFVLQDLTVVS